MTEGYTFLKLTIGFLTKKKRSLSLTDQNYQTNRTWLHFNSLFDLNILAVLKSFISVKECTLYTEQRHRWLVTSTQLIIPLLTLSTSKRADTNKHTYTLSQICMHSHNVQRCCTAGKARSNTVTLLPWATRWDFIT